MVDFPDDRMCPRCGRNEVKPAPSLWSRIRLAYRTALYYWNFPLGPDELIAFLGVFLFPVWFPLLLFWSWIIDPIRSVWKLRSRDAFDSHERALDYYQGRMKKTLTEPSETHNIAPD